MTHVAGPASATREILIATANPGKFREITAVLGAPDDAYPSLSVRWRSLADLAAAFPEPEETGTTFAENAALKARYYSRKTGLWTLSDDSGLEVDALGGAPGVVSARYAGVSSPGQREVADQANNRKLVMALTGIPPEQRTARFRCCLALAEGDAILAQSEGVIEGIILDNPRGLGGFGYDPHFLVPRLGKTTAELSLEEKNRLSHRGQALRAFRGQLARLLR